MTYYVEDSETYPGEKVRFKDGAWPSESTSGITENTNIRNALAAAGAGGIVEVSGGNYTGTQLNSTGKFPYPNANQVLRGSKVSGHDSPVVFSRDTGITGYLIELTTAGSQLNNINITSPADLSGAVCKFGGAGVEVNECRITDFGSLYFGTDFTGVVTLNHCIIDLAQNTSSAMNVNTNVAGAKVVFNYCLIKGMSRHIRAQLGDYEFNQCVFAGFQRRIIQTENPTVICNNCIFLGCGFGNDDAYLEYGPFSTSGTGHIILNNCITGANFWDVYGKPVSGNVTVSGNYENVDPQFSNPGLNNGILSLYLLDSTRITDGSLVHYQEVADEFGVHLTLFSDDTDDTEGAFSPGNLPTVQAFIDAGHELAAEGKSSSNLADSDCMTVSYSGSDTGVTLTVSNSGTTLAISTTEGNDNVGPIGISKTDQYKYIGDCHGAGTSLVSFLNSQPNYTSARLDKGQNEYDDTYAYCLADGSYNLSAGTQTLLLDRTGRFFNEEIDLTKSDLESYFPGYAVKSYFYTRYIYDADAEDRIEAAGYKVAFCQKNNFAQLKNIPSIFNINNSVTTWSMFRGSGYDALSETEKETRVRTSARIFSQGLRDNGLWSAVELFSDKTITQDEFRWFLSETISTGLKILSFAEAQAYIDNTSQRAGRAYTRAISDDNQYTLSGTSPAISTGVDIPALYGVPDRSGSYTYNKHNIGISEKAGAPSGTGSASLGGGMGSAGLWLA